MRNSFSKKLVLASMLAALTCVATMVIKIPSPLNGYINLGDGIVLLAGWMLPPGYSFLAAGVGSAMADIFSGYAAYAPATFVIKGLMAVIAALIVRVHPGTISRVVGGFAAEAVMVIGYLLFESMLYGFTPSLVNVPANCVQGLAGLAIALLLVKAVAGKFSPVESVN